VACARGWRCSSASRSPPCTTRSSRRSPGHDDHLFSFWLDGSFFGSDEVELTTPDAPDEGVATADVPLAELDLSLGQRVGYVFDFGDEWRVRLTVRERAAAERGEHPRVLELRGTPPPQCAGVDD
jgi:hypothetical protein